MKEQGNLIIAIVLSLLILLGFQYFFEAPKMKKEVERKEFLKKTEETFKENSFNSSEEISGYLDLNEALNKNKRIIISSPRLKGSISLKGLKIDDLTFKDYKENKSEELVTFFKPSSTKNGYFSNFGWINSDSEKILELPNDQTTWKSNSASIQRKVASAFP